MRLDLNLQERFPDVSRGVLQRLIRDGKVSVNETVRTKNGFAVKDRDNVKVDFDFDAKPIVEKIDMPVIYEDDDCVVVNKPIGILTHSKGAYNPEATVASWLADRPGFELENNDINMRSGIVHRLDRATSGVMICAKNQAALTHLQKQFQDRKAKKTYIARIEGTIKPEEALIDLPIERNPKQPQRFRVGHNGKPSQTGYLMTQSIEHKKGIDSILELKPLTGRTHQLRVHLDYMKHPIVGDTFYDGRPAKRLYLHAYQLEITLPNRTRQTFTAEVPPDFYEPETK
jgi:23S rRNA pseudouridine1911/1915/1917 synthase